MLNVPIMAYLGDFFKMMIFDILTAYHTKECVMDFRELSERVIDNARHYGEKFEIEMDDNFAMTKLLEEVGEFAQAKLIHDRKCRPTKYVNEAESRQMLAEELADIVGMAMVNADILGVDIEEALLKKWSKNHKE